ncbi:hypothetical protein C8R44DRAFT_389656 [Mycena epipterygia]|nr:hypothetical protein C8R44DRAFT_389656 [Mycena epipterygia]
MKASPRLFHRLPGGNVCDALNFFKSVSMTISSRHRKQRVHSMRKLSLKVQSRTNIPHSHMIKREGPKQDTGDDGIQHFRRIEFVCVGGQVRAIISIFPPLVIFTRHPWFPSIQLSGFVRNPSEFRS